MNPKEKTNDQNLLSLSILGTGEGKLRLYSLEALSKETGIDLEIVSLYLHLGLITPWETVHDKLYFNDDAVFLLKQFERLRLEHRMGFKALRSFYRMFKTLQK
ncbi:transcriptional regulator [Methylacidiphilum sp. Yel]|jgi:hypothetical protein|uniref:transcriptional regulator n=1 Tax=Methylacidiphilum sp. Yel TaxID=1847730 RepID=UPI00106D70AB|nr:transcriptional regulator [Methylacidiphilum sp. Yel]TFE70452.1 transcriptional regulator [Methylacidiphilum sp. Yel]